MLYYADVNTGYAAPWFNEGHFCFCCSSQAILSQSQDKALRRIGELREVLQLLLNVAVAWGQKVNT